MTDARQKQAEIDVASDIFRLANWYNDQIQGFRSIVINGSDIILETDKGQFHIRTTMVV